MSSWKPKNQRVQDALYELATQSMNQIAELVVDMEDQLTEKDERIGELEGSVKLAQERIEELEQASAALGQDYATLERDCQAMQLQLETLQDDHNHLKAVATMLNYRKDPV